MLCVACTFHMMACTKCALWGRRPQRNNFILFYLQFTCSLPWTEVEVWNYLVILFNMKYQVNPYAILLWETYILQFIFFTFVLGFPNKHRFRGNIFLFNDQEKETKKGIYPSVDMVIVDLYLISEKINLEKSSSMNWTFSLFRTGFLLPVCV